MKTLTIAIAALAVSTSFAQNIDIVTETTPSLGSAYSWSWNSDGSSVILTELPVHEALYSLPFGASFRAGHAGVIGNRVDPFTKLSGAVFGYEIYIKKDLSQGAYIKFNAHALIGESTNPLFGFGVGIGYQF